MHYSELRRLADESKFNRFHGGVLFWGALILILEASPARSAPSLDHSRSAAMQPLAGEDRDVRPGVALGTTA